MSTAFSRRMQGVGTRLLGKYGSTVTLERAGGKVWNPTTGEYDILPPQSIPLTSVPVPVNVGLINGTTIQDGDMVVKADYSVMPKMEDKVLFDGEQWSVVGIQKKKINDDPIVWFVQVRK